MGDPCFAIIYGVSKLGKTTDCLYSFPGALFMAAPGALKPAARVVGYDIPPQHVYAPRTVNEATKKLEEIGRNPRCQHCGTVITTVCADDFSILTEASLAQYENVKGGPWVPLNGDVMRLREVARYAKVHVILNAHERATSMVNGIAQRGGPKLPGKLPESFPAACDMVLRASVGATALGMRRGWSGVYQCGPSNLAFVTGDRHGVVPDGAPMNLAEILRIAEYEIPRPRALQWMDRAVEAVCAQLLKATPAEEMGVLGAAAQWLVEQLIYVAPYSQDPDPLRLRLQLHIRWVLRDAYDRAFLLRANSNAFQLFGLKLPSFPAVAAATPTVPAQLPQGGVHPQ